MFLYWPVAVVAVALFIALFPGPLLYHRSRWWWAFSNVLGPPVGARDRH
jgi:hypothetical protein